MRHKWLAATAGSLSLLTAMLFVFGGCGGSGGPTTGPETGSGPSPSAEFVALLPDVQKTATVVGSDKCAQCHNNDVNGTKSIHAAWSETKHAKVGTGCEQCHGPGSVHVAGPAKTNILTYPKISSVAVCGQCHGPTHDQWQQSRHEGVIEEVIEEGHTNPGTYVRTCFRCHSAQFQEQMIAAKRSIGETPTQIDARIAAMTPEQLDVFTPDTVTTSSAVCANCHDPHRNHPDHTTQNAGEGYFRRATFNTDTTAIAPATPAVPGVYTSYDHTCGNCHNARGGNPADAALTSGTARPNMHDSNQMNMLLGISAVVGPNPNIKASSHTTAPNQCIHCHMPTKRHTFTVSLDTGCAPCHTAADAAARMTATQNDIQNGAFALRNRLRNWAQDKFGDPDLWEYTTNMPEGKTAPAQTQVPIEVKRARHNYYFILRDKSMGVHNPFYAEYLLTIANQNLDSIGARSVVIRSGLPAQQVRAILMADVKRASLADLRNPGSN